jgi:hypothetical protein
VQAGLGTLDIEKTLQESGKAVQEGVQKELDTFKGLFGQ